MYKVLFSYLPSQIIPAIVMFILIGINSQYLGPKEFGIYALIIINIELLCLLSHQWIKASYTRYYNEYNDLLRSELSSTSDVLTILILIFVIILALLISFFIPPDYKEVFFSSIALFCIRTIFDYLKGKVRMAQLHVTYNISSIIFSLSSLIVTLFLYYNLEATVLITIYSLVLSYSIAVIILLIKSPLTFNQFSKDIVKKCFFYGFPLSISSVLSQLITKADRYFIVILLGSMAMGYYSAIIGIVHGLFALIFTTFAGPLYPEIIKASAVNKKHLNATVERYILLLMLATIPSAFGIYAVSDELVMLILGDEYLGVASELILYVIVSALLSNINMHLLCYGFIISEKTNLSIYVSILSLFTMILFNYIFISTHGLIGACYASISSLFISSIALCYFSRNKITFKVNHFIAHITLSALVMFSALIYCDIHVQFSAIVYGLTFKVLLGISIYLVCLTALSGGFTQLKRNLLLMANHE